MTLAIARGKAEALLPKYADRECLLITSDQVVVCEGKIREKPENEQQCREFLRSYSSGAAAECVNGVVVTNTKTREQFSGVARAQQFFKTITDDDATRLIAQGDCMWCCGGFVIEEMAALLDRREGEEECIRGMPKTLTLELLTKAQASASSKK